MKQLSRFALALFCASTANARVTRVEVESTKPAPAKAGAALYEVLSGVFYGELNPDDPANRIITDLNAARRNAKGMVEYSASFILSRPVNSTKASGLLYYEVPNRGFVATPGADPDGHIQLVSGWQGDLTPGPGIQWLKAPVASGIWGPALVRMSKVKAGNASYALGAGMGRVFTRAAPQSFDTSKARLVMSLRNLPDERIASSDWAFADCRTTPFPGTPDPAQLCLKNGFNPDAAYTLTYIGKDPIILGMGFAATRDLISYLRSGKPDDAGHPNPAGGPIKWTIGVGNSQSGNYLRSFTHLGFNADEKGRRVFDGINPNIAARQIVLNQRFGFPGGAAETYAPGSEGTLWWGKYNDVARRLGVTSLLNRCTKSKSCPKIVETFGSAEIWGLRMSPNLVGTNGRADIPLPANVRRYYFPSVTHGGGFGTGFAVIGDPPQGSCVLRGNPNLTKDQMRVARRWLVDWVKSGKVPPPSRYPTLANGDLVAPNAKAMGWPNITGQLRPDGHTNPFTDYDFGPGFFRSDVSGAMSREIPLDNGQLVQLVPRVNADGNETSGVPSVQLQVPLGTYTGWNEEASGYDRGRNCGFAGGFIPFARTKLQREAAGDPRLSLEERYGSHEGFVAKVREVVAREQAAGWLFPDDAARIIKEAETSEVLK